MTSLASTEIFTYFLKENIKVKSQSKLHIHNCCIKTNCINYQSSSILSLITLSEAFQNSHDLLATRHFFEYNNVHVCLMSDHLKMIKYECLNIFRKSKEDNVNSALFSLHLHFDDQDVVDVQNLSSPLKVHLPYLNVSLDLKK